MRVPTLLAASLLASCAAVPSGPPSMSLLHSDVSGLVKVQAPRNRHQWEAPGSSALRGFSALQLTHVEVDFSGPDPGPLAAIDTARIESTLRTRVEARLREVGIRLAPGAAPGVVQMRMRLAGLRYGDPVRGGTGETLRRQIRLQTLGIEGIFRDSETGEVLAVVLTRPRGATSVAERWSEMEDVLDLFARNFAREVAAERNRVD
ncbi:MAG: hypothetical protein CMJ94_01875 [Planctomycetes bacterium]|nr:hypothetical protein [Planctomycetota bacterium]